uniref:Reverse transcriptase domain-containing protein n=1 Tax=Tanacetum cinerariifolium TaxID=118510 RepID=A0A6L2KC83_TANCI|nr:hypothetical protein [Tanacetum cinerariifolium]
MLPSKLCDNAYLHDSPGVTPHIDHHCCYKCGDSLDGFFCHHCTCEFCGNGAHYGYNCPSHPEYYLRIRDEHLNTILETESDEFIKSSVENLVPSPSESEDEYFPNEIYLNPLFDEEIISIKIDPHHFNAESDLKESLFNQDSLIISSSKIDSLFDDFVGKLILLKSIPPGIDEAECDPEEDIRLINKLLYDNSSPHTPKEFISKNSDAAIESFFTSPIRVGDNDSLRDEIDLSLTLNDSIPPGIEDDDYDSERDILIFK